MANAAIKYASRLSYSGNAAYDLGRVGYGNAAPEIDRPFVDIPVELPKARPEVGTGVRTRTAVREKTQGQTLSIVSVIGFLIAAVLAVFILLGYVSLTEIAEESAQLESTLADLKVEETKLLVKYESAFNLTEVEKYAVSVLGMTHASESQVTYLYTQKDNGGIILDNGSENGGIKGLASFISSLLEYFK